MAEIERIRVTLVFSLQPRQIEQHELELPLGSTIADLLNNEALRTRMPASFSELLQNCSAGVWGRKQALTTVLQNQDRVELYRALRVDPKVARRERFNKQGARTTGLFAKQRPGAKAGY